MRILQLIQKPQLRGAEIFACQLSVELVSKGIHVDIVCLFYDHHSLKEKFPQLNFIDLSGNLSTRFVDLRAYKKLNNLIREGKYTVVQANAGDTLKYAALSKLLFGWKAGLVFRNANQLSWFIRSKIHAILTRLFLKQCDYIISVSETCRLDICRLYPKLSRRSETISIGTYDFSDVKPISRDTSEPVWVNIASFVREKNHQFLLELFNRFYTRTGKGYLWLVGDGPLLDAVKDRVREFALDSRVKFWGRTNDVIAILKTSDVMVMPSKIEGLPGVILESLVCRVPVVASSVGGIPEVIEDKITGICVTGYNAEEYLNKITKVLDEDHLRDRLIENGYQLVKTKFLMPEIADKFLNAYSKLVSPQSTN